MTQECFSATDYGNNKYGFLTNTDCLEHVEDYVRVIY